MMKPPRGCRPATARPAAGGFALILTLLILSVLAVVAVSFLTSMSAERGTANAFANKARAEAAAHAGADAAVATLRENLRAYPDSVTAWDVAQTTTTGTTLPNQGTSLYLRATSMSADDPNATGGSPAKVAVPNPAAENRPPNTIATVTDNRRNFVLPLISGVPKGLARLVSEKASILPAFPASDADPKDKDFEKTSTDLNVRRYAGDTLGAVGSPPGWTGSAPKSARAAWVTLKDDIDPKAVPLARYAFFVEDESFKAPVNLAGKDSLRADNSAQLGTPTNPLPVAPKNLALKGPLLALGLSDSSADSGAGNIYAARGLFPAARFADSRDTAQADGFPKANADAMRYVAATDSGALHLTRHGSQRVNLNALVPANTDPANTTLVQRQVDQLVKTLQFHLPNLGQRFYRAGAASDSATLNANAVQPDTTPPNSPANPINRPLIYFYKVAANLRDQLDNDSVPTVITNGGAVRGNAKPTIASPSENAPNEVWAQGKDTAPFIEECAVRFRGGPQNGNTRYSLSVDYYVEVWNMGTRDVSAGDLGPHPFLRITNPTRWVAYDTGSPEEHDLTSDDPAPASASPSDTRNSDPNRNLRDYDVDISGISFKAGVATVITTDPDFRDIIPSAEARSHVFVCSFVRPGPGKRVFNGPMPTHAVPAGSNTIRPYNGLRMRFQTTVSSDYETDVVLGNDNGYLDSVYGGLPIYNGGATSIVLPPTSGNPHPPFGGSLFGNGGLKPPTVSTPTPVPSVTGDPRSLNEQIVCKLYASGGNPDQNTRFFNSGSSGFTFGLPNTDVVQPNTPASPWTPWPDWCLVPSTITAADAPAVVANGPLTSIGQLGDVYDPARQPTTFDNVGINAARGGGRTFRLGQRDDRYYSDPTGNPAPAPTDPPVDPPDKSPTAKRLDGIPNSNGWASWRLADVFCLTNDLRVPGAVNLNGVSRDSGAALRAALTGFRFQPRTAASNPDPMVHGDGSLNSVGTDLPANSSSALVQAIVTRLASTDPAGNAPAGPFFERGEFGELNDATGKPLFGRTFAGSTPAATAASKTLDGVDMNQVTDRGREEVFRRLAEVVCTRGDTFTVHAVGQALTPPDPTGRQRVTATQRLRVTFRLRPKMKDPSNAGKFLDFLPGSPIDKPGTFFDFNPNTPGTRFDPPDHYDVEILQASSV